MQHPAILTPMYPSQEPYASIHTAQTPGGPFFDPGHELRPTFAAGPRRRPPCAASSTSLRPWYGSARFLDVFAP